jgi:hypothetical protein
MPYQLRYCVPKLNAPMISKLFPHFNNPIEFFNCIGFLARDFAPWLRASTCLTYLMKALMNFALV